MNHQPNETAFKDAMKKAGVVTDASRLYNLAVDELRKHKMHEMRSARALTEIVRAECGLMAALVSSELTFTAARAYIERVARDMRNEQVSRDKRDGAAHVACESRRIVGRPANSPQDKPVFVESHWRGKPGEVSAQADGGVRDMDDGRMAVGSPDISAQADGAVHRSPELRSESGRPDNSPKGAGGARPKGESRILLGASKTSGEREHTSTIGESPRQEVVPLPGKAKRGLAELKAIKAACPSIFDTLTLRDGIPLGDLRWSQLDRYIAANAREAKLLEMVRNYGVPADPNAKIRDVVREADMRKMVANSAGA